MRRAIPPREVFGMIDSLIDRVKTHNDTHQPNGRAGRLTLRSKYEWSDRLHNYAFPWFFPGTKMRTVQAIHYDMPQLNGQRVASLCRSSTRRRRPLTCGDSWPIFGRICASTDPLCRAVGDIHTHLPTRLYALLDKYPNHTMDFVLLEGVDDPSRSSLTCQGYKNVDVVALARIRKCLSTVNGSASACETILVDDFRYEASALVTNVREWFWITAILRGIGQLYAWMRLAFLLAGCYAARANMPGPRHTSYFALARATLRTVFVLPSQVMVYGSLFPISCYVVAHLIDASAVYELMAMQISTTMGTMSLEFWVLVRVCAVSMRSLWLLAFVCHVIHRIASQCAMSQVHGVPGIPEFSLSFIASLTILAQVRYPSLRDSRVLSVHELVPSATRYHCSRTQSDSSHSFLYKLLLGTVVDYKCLAVSVCLQIGVVLLMGLVHRLFPRCVKYQPVLFTQTTVSYSANSLWPGSALVVSWNGTFLSKPPPCTPNTSLPSSVGPLAILSRPVEHGISSPNRVTVHSTQQPWFLPAASEQYPASIHQHVSSRSHDSETLIFLMNLGVMTDPLTFARLRIYPGRLIGVYTDSRPHSPRAGTSILLPLSLSTSPSDIPIDWSELELRFVVHTSELDWCDLLRCG